ncbi:hypothetical protein KSP40_PGU020809 [Platanthera guangdongensis]|uniref:Tryptophan synthase n=1 Tax=Platanthera guangdongensis TaxID=2320717 RepID=A0ABR2MVE6_9ASPA
MADDYKFLSSYFQTTGDIFHDAYDFYYHKELDGILRDFVGRETPLYFAEQLTQHYKNSKGEGPLIFLKREDLNHTGAHKINNAVAQALLAKRIGKKRIIAETGAGQHGVATATVCARFGLQCIIYMGAQDMERQSLNVFRMRLLGAECYFEIDVKAVHSGTATLKDATSEAIRDWVTNVETTHYILGSVAGPHPYPMMVRDFHAVIGKETRRQALEKWGGKPDVLVACVGGGSNAMGLFHEFVDDRDVRLIGVEAAGFGLESGKHAATLTKGEIGVLHGAMSYLLQDDDGQIIEPHSISAGLDYPGVGPEHSFLKDIGRAEYYSVTDDEALEERAPRLEETQARKKMIRAEERWTCEGHKLERVTMCSYNEIEGNLLAEETPQNRLRVAVMEGWKSTISELV